MDNDVLQLLLNKYPAFNWVGDMGRRQKGQARFVLGKAAELGVTTADADYEIFVIRAFPADLVRHLRQFFYLELGEAAVKGNLDDAKVMIADAQALNEIFPEAQS